MREANRVILVKATWDEEAGVWFAASDDVPGLNAEAETLEELDKAVTCLIPELLELNTGAIPEGDGVSFDLLVHSKYGKTGTNGRQGC